MANKDIDQNKTCPVDVEEVNRRTFLGQFTTILISFSMVVTGGFGIATVIKFLQPPEIDLEGRSELGWLEIGVLSDFNETPKKVDYGDEPVFIYLRNKKLIAFSAFCPHVRCIITFDPEGKPDPKTKTPVYECPCHAAAFDLAGRVLHGPPTRGLYKQKLKVKDKNVLLGGGTPAV